MHTSEPRDQHSDVPILPVDGEIHYRNANYLSLDDLTQPAVTEAARESRVLVMGSGSGSNFEALVAALRPFGVLFTGLFCDRYGTMITERAERLKIPITQPPPQSKRQALNDAVLAFLDQPFDLLLLAGYMRILPPRVIAPHEGKIINIHPSLLPAFPGLNAIQQAHDANVPHTGISVHLVNEKVDDGPILSQARLPIQKDEPIESLEQRIHALEHRLYPETVLRCLIKQRNHRGDLTK